MPDLNYYKEGSQKRFGGSNDLGGAILQGAVAYKNTGDSWKNIMDPYTGKYITEALSDWSAQDQTLKNTYSGGVNAYGETLGGFTSNPIIPQNIPSINSSTLTPQPDLSQLIATPQVQSPPIPYIDTTQPMALTQPETDVQKRIKGIIDLNDQSLGEAQYRSQLEQSQGLPDLMKTQNDLTNQLKQLTAEAQAIPLQLQENALGRGITAGGLAPIQTGQLRQNAIKSLSVSSLLEASRGNIALANDLVDRAVKAKFDPIREQIDIATKNLDLILKSPEYTLAEKNRAEQQKQLQENKAKQLAKQEADSKEIYNIGLTALKFGADLQTVQKIQSAKSPQEAIQIGGNFLQDPMAKYELESARLDNILKQEEAKTASLERSLLNEKILTERTQRGQIGKPTSKEIQESQQAVENAKESIPLVQDKINLINSLLNSPGLNSSVGTNKLGRTALTDKLTGSAQSFAGGVTQLLNQETIDTLINLKAKGGTLGALSDQERILLQSAATKIGKWEIKDKNNNGTGKYNIDEASFKAELNRIKELAQRALDKATGKLISSEEKSTLNDLFNSTSTQSMNFNPSSYY